MYAVSIVVKSSFEDTMEQIREALQACGLGIVSDVDVAAVIRNKLGEEIGGYRILGACAPKLAKKVITSDPAAGALLPCNLVVRTIDEESTGVDFMSPTEVLALAGTSEINEVAKEAEDILARVRAHLGA